jgi:DNA-binding beta-propeller fold protein YncE
MKTLPVFGVLIGLLPACGASEPTAQTPPVAAASTPAALPAPPPSEPAPPLAAASATAPPAPAPAAKPEPVLSIREAGFVRPESVLYDAKNDVYLVTNINGSPSAADNNGFVSRVTPEGKVELKWIEAGKKGVKLDAPKGSAAVGDTLYVADITRVRMFDLTSGKPKGEIALPGATFANDVAAGPDGKIYVSDTGVKLDEKGMTPTKSDAVYVIEKGKAKIFAKGEDLGQPNGLLVSGDKVWVVTLGSGELYALDKAGKKVDAQKLPKGHLDGLIGVGDDFLITSHEAHAIYRGKPGGAFEVVMGDFKAPADIGYDTKRARVLVPDLQDSTVEAYDLK